MQLQEFWLALFYLRLLLRRLLFASALLQSLLSIPDHRRERDTSGRPAIIAGMVLATCGFRGAMRIRRVRAQCGYLATGQTVVVVMSSWKDTGAKLYC